MLIRLYRRLAGQQALEECFYIEFARMPEAHELALVKWLIAGPSEEITHEPHYRGEAVEVGPRLSVETPFSTNATGICRLMGLPVSRVECSTRYPEGIAPSIDPLTQQVYPEPLTSFAAGHVPEAVQFVDVLAEGEQALAGANVALGLGMDDADLAYYTQMFRRLGRNPTDVELFQIGNGNSEHSRHHFFGGIQVIDGVEMPESLMTIVKAPWNANKGNSLTAFHDNSGVIIGTNVKALAPASPLAPSAFEIREVLQHITATAETHNHPTLIAPFPGANTGSGGRIRDSRAVGRGGLVHAGLAGYCVGNLHLPNFAIPGEDIGGETNTQASPLQILLRGSDGVSDYGNKIGEPLLGGFTRSFGQIVQSKRREFRKPVLYSAGFGRLDDRHLRKHEAEAGMHIVRIGGPAYRIGVGGGSASSMMQGTNAAELDLKSVQRGNPEMENRVNRVIQTCAEMGNHNPIESIHDQGAGGPSNVLTELMEPAGGHVDIRKIVLGDQTMSVLEIWVAEYQEGYGLLIRPENLEVFQAICERERVNCEVLGEISGDGNVVVLDSATGTSPVHLGLSDILSKVPRKRFPSNREKTGYPVLKIPEGLTVDDALQQVFKLPQVGSKGFLMRKVDRSVTGLVARQQCCGPMQVPVADAAVTADGYFGSTGAAAAIGEQPIKMLIAPDAGARMAVAEMLTNMASVRISSLPDITCRANWMWAAKLPGEGALLYEAAVSMRDFMLRLGIKIDGGKDSLSMAAKVGDTQVVSPGELVIMGYAPVPDIEKVATPDFKGSGCIGFINIGGPYRRLGGSALAQALGQVGNETPDICPLNGVHDLVNAFNAVQELIDNGLITAYHDRSDGGLITAVAEMCIAGNRGATLRYHYGINALAELFCEEAGMVFEYAPASRSAIARVMRNHGVFYKQIGEVGKEGGNLYILSGTTRLLDRPVSELRQWWEATSTELELLQANPETVRQEAASFTEGKGPSYRLSFTPKRSDVIAGDKPRVAILREEGTNGDREMAAACVAAGLEPWDVSMNDILSGKLTTFDTFKGLIFPGGFSYADVFGSAKGWAGPILFTNRVREMFNRFYDRKDTFTLGVCNGCQLMANIGWLPYRNVPVASQPRFVHNTSGRFEARWAGVKVLPSPSILLRGMEGSVLGIQVAHGEGKMLLPDPLIAEEIRKQQLVPLVYVDADGQPTEAYPYNPNGSPHGWTALCSPDGRHLAMMPHPERCFLKWQWPWMPSEWRKSLEASPWLQMFQNARTWCDEHA
jgi:phosphoribosylformylglycinamidine synthase